VSNWLHEQKWQEVEEYLKNRDLVLLPIGSTEQHGRHLPLFTDTAEAIAVAEGVAEQTGALIAPPVHYGWSPQHMGYPGCVTLRAEVLISMVEDIAISLCHHGFRKLVIVHGHRVANLPWMELAAMKIKEKTGMYVAVVDVALIAASEIRAICTSEPGGIGHACESETSFMLHKHPHLVDMDLAVKQVRPRPKVFRHGLTTFEPAEAAMNSVIVKRSWEESTRANAPAGISGDPTAATQDKGKRIYETIVAQVSRFITEDVLPQTVTTKKLAEIPV
jgi:creatinine amidohydrolase